MYYPKNKIITNQYTNGGEYQYLISKLPYNGYYWKTFEGKFYTGKNPNDKPIIELKLIQQSENFYNPINPKMIIDLGYDGLSIFEESKSQPYNEELILKYLSLKKISTNNLPMKDYPIIYYPKPTEEDYKNENIIRYFLIKINSPSYMEVNKETYDKIIKKDNSIVHELFTPFFIVWSLFTDKDKMFNSNKNITLLQEKRLKKTGLGQYLGFDFSKFHKNNLVN